MKKKLRKLVAGLGAAVLREDEQREVAMAMRLRRIFAERRIDQVIDVGANAGQFRGFLRDKVRFKGRIVSFEPVPELAERLTARAASDPLWTVRARALGAEPGELAINVMSASVFSSFREPLGAGPEIDKMNRVARTEAVPVSTLDAEFAGQRGLRHTYLKLDTQGFDLEVLRGGRQVLAEIPALQTEVSFRPLYEGMPSYAESIAAFERCGFAVADLFLVAADDVGRAMEFDCIMIR